MSTPLAVVSYTVLFHKLLQLYPPPFPPSPPPKSVHFDISFLVHTKLLDLVDGFLSGGLAFKQQSICVIYNPQHTFTNTSMNCQSLCLNQSWHVMWPCLRGPWSLQPVTTFNSVKHSSHLSGDTTGDHSWPPTSVQNTRLWVLVMDTHTGGVLEEAKNAERRITREKKPASEWGLWKGHCSPDARW